MLRRQGACGHLKFPWKPKMQCLQVEQLQPFQNRVWISVPSLALPGSAHCPPGPSFDQRCPKLWWNKPGWFFFSKPLPDATLSPSLCQGLTRHVHDWRNRHQAMHCKKNKDWTVSSWTCWWAFFAGKQQLETYIHTANTIQHATWKPKTLEHKVHPQPNMLHEYQKLLSPRSITSHHQFLLRSLQTTMDTKIQLGTQNYLGSKLPGTDTANATQCANAT